MKIYKLLLAFCLLAAGWWACDDDNKTPEEGSGVLNSGTVSFTEETIAVLENGGILQIPLQLSEPAKSQVKIGIAVKKNPEYTAEEEKDFHIISKVITFEAGSTEAFAEIEVINNEKVDRNTLFELEISQVFTAGIQKTEKKQSCKVAIMSNAFVYFPQTELHTWEVVGHFQIPLELKGEITEPVKVKLLIKPETALMPDHFNITQLEYVFEPGGVTSHNIDVELTDNLVRNEARSFQIEIESVSGDKATALSMGQKCLLSILDDDYLPAFEQETYEVEENAGELPIRISIPGSAYKDMNIELEVETNGMTEGEDFEIESPIVTIPQDGNEAYAIIKIKKAQALQNSDPSFRLKVKKVYDEEITEEVACQVTVWDCDAVLSFARTENKAYTQNKIVEIPIRLDRALFHDVKLKIESANVKGWSENKDFTIQSKEITIPKGSKEAKIVAYVSAAPQVGAGFDVKIGSVSGVVPPTNVTASLTMTGQKDLSRDNWTVTANTENSDAPISRVLDGDESTFWHSKWAGGKTPYPHLVTIDMKEENYVSSVTVVRRKDKGDTKRLQIYVSTDKENWGDVVGELSWSSASDTPTKEVTISKNVCGQYLLIKSIDGYEDNVTSLAEIYVKGY